MSGPTKPRNRRRQIMLGVAGTFVLAASITVYICWTRLSARMVLRWFVRETGIPVEVKSASWDARLREVLAGKIRQLHLEVYYRPLDTDFVFDSPVDYKRDKATGHWSIALAPTLQIGKFPAASGTIALELDVKRKGRKATASGASVDLHLHQTKPLALAGPAGAVTAQTWRIDGWINWDRDWSSHLDLRFGDVKVEKPAGPALSAKTVQLGADTTWPDSPPLPFDVKGDVKATGLELLHDGLFITEPVASFKTSFHFGGRRFEHVDVSVDKPVRLTAHGSFGDGALDTDFKLRGDLDELLTQRAAQWFEGQAPLLRRAKAKGTLDVAGHLRHSPERGYSGKARLRLNADSVEFPARELYVDGLSVDAPLEFPGDPDWGKVSIKTAEFHSVKLKNLAVSARLGLGGVDVTTEDDAGRDQPIRQSVWGGTIDIKDLYAHVGGTKDTEFTAAVSGGPFQIPAIQSDLCILPKNPIKGQLSFTYPEVVLDRDSIALVGGINAEVFNGTAHVGDLRVNFRERSPRLYFDAEWNDLDLQAIGEWTNIGDMRGSLFGSFTNAKLALSPIGPIPLSYDLTFHPMERGGRPIRFYGRTVNSIVRMLSGGKDIYDEISTDMASSAASLLLRAGNTFRTFWINLTPHVHYAGFQAKNNGDWTTLTTFDPLDEPCIPNHSEKHFLLCGTSFKIPLNTYDVYPVVLKTSAFHSWLAGIVQGIKWRSGNGKSHDKNSDDQQCTPLW